MEVSNVKAMRDALLKASDVLTETAHHNLTEEHINECLALIHTALAEPPRNCDVGTAEEQEERYFKLKKEYIDRVTYCPAVGQSWFPESLYWAQMEYEGEAEQ